MAQFTMRDMPPKIWGHALTRARLEGWKMQDLIMALLEGYATGRIVPDTPPSNPPAAIIGGVVAIPFTCPKCNKTMTVECRTGQGFGYMAFYAVACPHCHQITERQLPDRIVNVR